jgi:hypothetical protein
MIIQGPPLLVERFDARTLLDVLPEDLSEAPVGDGAGAALSTLRVFDGDVTPQVLFNGAL